MGADVQVRQGDTYPPLTETITDPQGNPLDLTGATVTFTLRAITSNTPTVGAGTVTVVTASQGLVTYAWGVNDSATAGMFAGEFHVTQADATKYTWPSEGYLTIEFVENLTTTGGATIVALGDVKARLNIPASTRTHDRALLQLITGFTPVCERYVGAMLPKSYQEWHNGGQTFIVPRHTPVISIQSVVEWRGPIAYVLSSIGDPTKGSIYSYHFDPQTDQVTRRSAGGGVTAFPAMPNSVQIDYTAGRSVVPDNVREGMLELIRIFWVQTQQFRQQTSGPGYQADEAIPVAEVVGFLVPGKVRELWAPSKRAPAIA